MYYLILTDFREVDAVIFVVPDSGPHNTHNATSATFLYLHCIFFFKFGLCGTF